MALPVGGGDGLTDATSNSGSGGADWPNAPNAAKTTRPAPAMVRATRWICPLFIDIVAPQAGNSREYRRIFLIIDDLATETLLTIRQPKSFEPNSEQDTFRRRQPPWIPAGDCPPGSRRKTQIPAYRIIPLR
jgi:hypothetical protein